MTDSKLLELIELTYAAADDRSLWEPLLLSMARSVGGAGACLIAHDLIASGSVAALAGFDPDGLTLYNEYYHQVDAWALAQHANWRENVGRARPDQSFLRRHDLKKTEFYPFLHRLGIARMMHATVRSGPEGVTGISIYRSESDLPFESREVRFIEALVPHLRRSLRLHSTIMQARVEKDAALDGFDALTHGVLLVTAEARIVHANRSARFVLEERDGLWADKEYLSAASTADTVSLRELCAACSRTTRGNGTDAGGPVSIARPSGRRNLLVVVSPIRRREPFGVHDDSVTALVFVSDPERDRPPDTDLLQVYYGLTPTEAQVAARLATGESLEEIAAARHYTKQTAQWYTKQILNRTGCRTRGQFVRQVSMTLSSLTVPRRARTRRSSR